MCSNSERSILNVAKYIFYAFKLRKESLSNIQIHCLQLVILLSFNIVVSSQTISCRIMTKVIYYHGYKHLNMFYTNKVLILL